MTTSPYSCYPIILWCVKYHFLTVSTSMHVRLYTPLLTHHALPPPLHPNACVFVLCSEKECQEPTQSLETPLDESPEWVCVSGGVWLQKRHTLICQFLGNLKCHYCESKSHTRHLNIVVMNICMLKRVMVTMSFHVLELQRTQNQKARATLMEEPVKRWISAQSRVKGIVHPKMKILSLITHPHVVPNP